MREDEEDGGLEEETGQERNFRPAGGQRSSSRLHCCFELKSARGAAGWSVAGGGRGGGGGGGGGGSTASEEQQEQHDNPDRRVREGRGGGGSCASNEGVSEL